MKNSCPSCGANLFTQEEMNDLSLLGDRVMNQDFGSEFDELKAFDAALFILNEIKNGVGQKYLQKIIKESSGEANSVSEETVEFSEDDDLAKIREEVEKEVLGESFSSSDEPDGSLKPHVPSEESKVDRLKKIARQSGLKTGARVRRVGS